VHDGGKIVRAKIALDETPRLLPRDRGSRRIHVETVHHEHVQPSFSNGGVRHDVGLDRRRSVQRPIGPLDWNVNEREQGDRGRPAVLADFEIVGGQAAHEGAGRVRDARVDLDEVRGGAKRRRGRLPRGRRRLRVRCSGPHDR
jgi:hypothetical protein